MMYETYEQARHANGHRLSCIDCHAPCAYSREYRATRRCDSCYRDTPIITQPKELIHVRV